MPLSFPSREGSSRSIFVGHSRDPDRFAEAAGYSVEAVATGHAALAAASRETFDADLDVDMPGIDSLAVGRAWRRPRTPVDDRDAYQPRRGHVRTGFDGTTRSCPSRATRGCSANASAG
jgi:hypothetical protein